VIAREWRLFAMKHLTTNVQQILRDYIVDRYLSPDDADSFSDDDDLLAMLDSLQVLRLLIDMERQFSIHVDNSELTPDNLGTVNKLANFLEQKLPANT
jgi:acyl carrier protein